MKKSYTNEQKLKFWINKAEFSAKKVKEYEEKLAMGITEDVPQLDAKDFQIDMLQKRVDELITKIGLVEDKVDFGKGV